MPDYDNTDDDDYVPPPPMEEVAPPRLARKDVVREFTSGAIGTKEAATGVKLVSGFIPGGTLIDLGATAAIADYESQEARDQWHAWAEKLGCTPDFLMCNSESLRALAKEETEDHVGSRLSDWAGTTVGGGIGAALGYVVPIPGASLVLGYVGSQIGGSFGTERAQSETNVRDIANEIERKQYYGEEITPDEAFLLALAPKDREDIYRIMKAQIPEGTDPLTAKHIFKGIALDNSYRIKDKVISLGIDVEDGEFPSVALANAMNETNQDTGKKLHPLLVLLDNPDNVPIIAQRQAMGAAQPDNAVNGDGAELADYGNGYRAPMPMRGMPPAGAGTMQDVGNDGAYEAPNNLPPKGNGNGSRRFNPRQLQRR